MKRSVRFFVSAILATSFGLSTASDAADPKTMIILGKIAAQNADLEPLLDVPAFFEAALASPNANHLGRIQSWINDDVKSVRAGKLRDLLRTQLETLQATEGSLAHVALSELYMNQLGALAAADETKLSAADVAALIVINEALMASKDDSEALEARAKAESARLLETVRGGATLHTYVSQHSSIQENADYIGTIGLEYTLASGEAAKQAALEALSQVVPPEQLQSTLTSLNEIATTIAARSSEEKQRLLTKLKNDPFFLGEVTIGIGTGVAGVILGNPFMVLSSVWSVFGDSIRTHLPINQLLLNTAQMVRDVASLKSESDRQAAVESMKTRLQGLGNQTAEMVLLCGSKVGAACEKLVGPEQLKAGQDAAHALFAETQARLQGVTAESVMNSSAEVIGAFSKMAGAHARGLCRWALDGSKNSKKED